MAEVLIQWKGHLGDPALPKKGDIRDVKPNGTDWGTHVDKSLWTAAGNDPAEFPPDYSIVIVNNISVPNLMKMKRQGRRAMEPAEIEPFMDEADKIVRLHKFVWRINISEMTPTQRSTINNERIVIIPKAKFIEISEHKIKTVTFDENDPDGEGGLRLPGLG